MAKKANVSKKQNKVQKEKREEIKQAYEYDQNAKSIIFNIVGVLLVLALFYLITTLVTNNKPLLHEKDKIPATIQYDEILAGETFNMPESEYYVLFFDFDGSNATYYNTIAKAAKTKTYVVNISDPFNKSYVSDQTNKNVQNVSDLKVKEATLIRIKNKRNISYFEGELVSIKENLE